MIENVFYIDNKEFTASSLIFKEFDVKSIFKNYHLSIIDEPETYRKVLEYAINNKILFVDSNVNTLHYISKKLENKDKLIVREASENLKTIEGALEIISLFDEKNITKNENIIVCGGGIIQDVVAFSSSVYKRGIPWAFFPTTLLSMCDSCLGGKASLNYKNAKNQIALYSTPKEIIINPNFLRTLPEQDIRSGLGEILKMFIIGGEAYFDLYKEIIKNISFSNTSEFIPLICNSLNIKKNIVEADEYEKDSRKVLNYGHTVGHAIEILSEYKIPHGLSIVAGMIIANELSSEYGYISKLEKTAINNICYDLLGEKTLNTLKNLDFSSISDIIIKDKKASDNNISFVFIKSLGKSVFKEIILTDAINKKIGDIISHSFL